MAIDFAQGRVSSKVINGIGAINPLLILPPDDAKTRVAASQQIAILGVGFCFNQRFKEGNCFCQIVVWAKFAAAWAWGPANA